MGNSNVHNHKRCPLFLAGKAGGALRGNLHLKAADGTPMANVFLSLLQRLGLDDMKSFGDSTGRFDLNLYWCRCAEDGHEHEVHQRAFRKGLVRTARRVVGVVASAAALGWLPCGRHVAVAGVLGAMRRSTSAPVADAATQRDREAVRTLLKNGEDVNARAGRRHDGAALGGPQRRSRADADAALRRREREGDARACAATRRSLMAADQGHASVIAALISGGADAKAPNVARHHARDAGGGVG